MSKVWVIIGASSVIAREFAKLIANQAHEILLVGRNIEDINLTANDIMLRSSIKVRTLNVDLIKEAELNALLKQLKSIQDEVSLYLAHSLTYENEQLSQAHLKALIDCNITATTTLIHTFVNDCKKPKQLVYLSSVAGTRGRKKNSLYGASKKMIEVYIDGLRASHPHIHFYTPRLGFIDTKETYGKAGIFYALPPKRLAQNTIGALKKVRQKGYLPFFGAILCGLLNLFLTSSFLSSIFRGVS
jgi:hypothetical protein